MFIFDTSIWIDAINGQKNKAVELLIEKSISNEVVLIPVIIQEILQGIKDDVHYHEIKANLLGYVIIADDALDCAVGAANLYRNLIKRGITIRKSNDCLIAYAAIKNNYFLVHNDSDFDLMASGSELKVIK